MVGINPVAALSACPSCLDNSLAWSLFKLFMVLLAKLLSWLVVFFWLSLLYGCAPGLSRQVLNPPNSNMLASGTLIAITLAIHLHALPWSDGSQRHSYITWGEGSQKHSQHEMHPRVLRNTHNIYHGMRVLSWWLHCYCLCVDSGGVTRYCVFP